MVTYIAEQRIWADPRNERRYSKVAGYVGFSDRENSPFKVTSAVSFEAFGVNDCRPNDRIGIAWFYSALNDDFQNAFSTTTPIGDVFGGEVYYNAAITPWFHLTLDLQVIEPAIDANDTALVLGLRAKTTF